MEDMIDFPCNPDWLDHYHLRGLTPRHSGRNRELEELNKKIEMMLQQQQKQNENIEKLLRILIYELKSLKNSRNTSYEKQNNIDKNNEEEENSLIDLL